MKPWMLLLTGVALLGIAIGCGVWIYTHPGLPTPAEISNCRRSYGCDVDELRR